MTAFGGAIGAVAPNRITRLRAVLSRRSPTPLLNHEGPDALLLGAATATGSFVHHFGAAPHGLRLTGDMRLDDPDCLPPVPGRSQVDRLLAAFRQDGPQICAGLSGDFAIAIWDQDHRCLCLMRDHMGVRPLFYRRSGAGLIFASEARALRAQDTPPEPDAASLSAYLSGLPHYPEEVGSEGICRLMPGHWLTWTPEAMERRRYWSLTLDERPDDNATETFRDLFFRAVSARMRGDGSDGALLSGGMDSSSICVAAAQVGRRPLPTYSMIYGGQPALDESAYIDAVLATGPSAFQPCKIDMSDTPPLAGFDLEVQTQDGLFTAPGFSAIGQVHRRAAADGIRVLLDGHGGDEAVWYGNGRLLELAAQGRWPTVLSLLSTQKGLSGESRLGILVTLLRMNARGSLLGRTLFRTLRRLQNARGNSTGQGPAAWQRYLRDDYIARTDIETRFRAFYDSVPGIQHSDRASHLRALTSPMVPMALEVLHNSSTDAGVELRFPFFDRRLVEFCLALPASDKMRRGETRSVLRRALADALPPEVLYRRDKVDFGPNLARGLVRFHDGVLSGMAADSHGRLDAVMDMDTLRDGIARLRRDPSALDSSETMLIWRAAGLHLLETSNQRGHAAA